MANLAMDSDVDTVTTAIEAMLAKDEYLVMLQHRARTERAYRQAKAVNRLSMLSTTKSRQPVRGYQIGDGGNGVTENYRRESAPAGSGQPEWR